MKAAHVLAHVPLGKRTRLVREASKMLYLVAFAFCLLASRSSSGVSIDVRGRAHLLASEECDANRLTCTLRGSLRDDLGDPMSNQPIRLALENGDTPLTRVEDCTRDTHAAGSGTDAVVTNETGEFCARLGSNQPLGGVLRLEYTGDARTDADSTRVELGSTRIATEIDWLNRRKQLELDALESLVELRLTAATAPAPQQQISLSIIDEQSAREVLRVTEGTDVSGIARFRLQAQRLGTAGLARLRASFGGAPKLAPVVRSWRAFRVCNVNVKPDRFERRIGIGERARVSVTVKAGCADAVPGIVEFRSENRLLHRAPVKNNEATWHFSTTSHRPGRLEVTASYVPPSEGWLAGERARFEFVIEPASRSASAFWLIASIGLALWLTIKWGRGAIQPLLKHVQVSKAENGTSMDRIAPEPGKSGWYGVVLDAHTGLPVPHARLCVEHPGFAERQITASTISSDAGEFALPPFVPRDLSCLRVEARYYNDGQWPLPSQGRLTIRLQTTRRAILQAFVTWFETSISKGPAPAEPTPAQVQLGTTHEQSAAVAEWATNVEKAAFGPTAPEADAKGLLSGPSRASNFRNQA